MRLLFVILILSLGKAQAENLMDHSRTYLCAQVDRSLELTFRSYLVEAQRTYAIEIKLKDHQGKITSSGRVASKGTGQELSLDGEKSRIVFNAVKFGTKSSIVVMEQSFADDEVNKKGKKIIVNSVLANYTPDFNRVAEGDEMFNCILKND